MGELDPAGAGAPSVLAQVAARAAAQAGAENFPVALRLLPRTPRGRLQRVYAFARFVDDIGDEAPGDRCALLDLVDADVRALTGGTPRLPVVQGLQELLDQCQVPIQEFLDLIQANRLDQTVGSYQTFDDLLGYCRLSAAPIGRMVLHVADAASPQNIRDSDSVCSALQVLEHCQDVGEDAAAGRVYLPDSDLVEAGVAPGDLRCAPATGALCNVVAIQVARALDLLRPGRALVARLGGWPRIAVAGYVAGGLATADALTRADYDVQSCHLGPSKRRIARYATSLVLGR